MARNIMGRIVDHKPDLLIRDPTLHRVWGVIFYERAIWLAVDSCGAFAGCFFIVFQYVTSNKRYFVSNMFNSIFMGIRINNKFMYFFKKSPKKYA